MADDCPVIGVVLLSAGVWLVALSSSTTGYPARSVLTRVARAWPKERKEIVDGTLLNAACGVSLVLYGPLTGLPSHYATALVATLGVCLSLLQNMIMAIFASISLAFGAACMFWQLGACRADVMVLGYRVVHPLLLFAMAVFILRIFIFRDGRGLSEEELWIPILRVLVPLLGGLLTSAGAVSLANDGLLRGAPRVERFLLGVMPPRALVLPEPCPAASGDLGPAALLLALWLGATAAGVGLQALFARACWQSGASGHPQDLTKDLLTIDGDKDEDGPTTLPKVSLNHPNSRHQVILDAMNGPEGQDLSHLSEDERGIVKVLREDENERARYLFGGGLW